ncbi:unnamed protein product [Amoebophrya sp. A25]|nr:unnamed protein product [Amoebophrya sp. A25]|eukprot:GSA25T00004816001.1
MSESSLLFNVLLFLAGSVTYSLLSFLPNLAKLGQKQIAFDAASVVFFAELAKLFLSLGFLYREELSNSSDEKSAAGDAEKSKMKNASKPSANKNTLAAFSRLLFQRLATRRMGEEILGFMIPAILYAINNNLDTLLCSHMDGVTQQVLLQNKIMVTSVLYWVVFRRVLDFRQWFALGILTCGSAIAVAGNDAARLLVFYAGSASSKLSGSLADEELVVVADSGASGIFRGITGGAMSTSSSTTTTTFCTTRGLMLTLVYCICSASASIYCEYVYTRDAGQSVHVASVAMYTGGLLVNYSMFCHSAGRIQGIGFDGWNIFTVFDCCNKALLGLTLGYVMRYLGNLHKLFMFGASMFVSAFLGMLSKRLLPDHTGVHWEPAGGKIVGMMLVVCSLLLFNWKDLRQVLFAGRSRTSGKVGKSNTAETEAMTSTTQDKGKRSQSRSRSRTRSRQTSFSPRKLRQRSRTDKNKGVIGKKERS